MHGETGRTVLEQPIVVEGGALLPAGEYVHMTVRDTGPGIPASLRGRIFERFFTTKHDSGVGGGFGLSTVQRIVRGRGGIVLESPPDWGAAFHVYLPIRDGLPREPAPKLVSAALPAPTSGVRVLVIEHDPSVRELVKRMLTLAGHAAAAVGTAADGLRAFDGTRPPFDAALIDLVLPDRTGSVLARALRRRRPDLAVVFMSGYGDVEEGGAASPAASSPSRSARSSWSRRSGRRWPGRRTAPRTTAHSGGRTPPRAPAPSSLSSWGFPERRWRRPNCLLWVTSWESRFLPHIPTLDVVDPRRTRAFGTFLLWERRF